MTKLNSSPERQRRRSSLPEAELEIFTVDSDQISSENNLEYDLRTSEWICEKAKQDATYAVNVYRALCNNVFQRADVWPILKDETWSCSWRYAGGIVADMIEDGDYLDFYCAGYEGTVTDEFAADLRQLGWIVLQNRDNG